MPVSLNPCPMRTRRKTDEEAFRRTRRLTPPKPRAWLRCVACAGRSARQRPGGPAIVTAPNNALKVSSEGSAALKWTYAYEVDGAPVQITRVSQERPQVYAVRAGDGQVLGYVQRTLTGRVKACAGSALPDLGGAAWVGMNWNMGEAVAHVVQAATEHDDTPAPCTRDGS